MSLEAQNIAERVYIFGGCIQSADDTYIIHQNDEIIYCCNCARPCKPSDKDLIGTTRRPNLHSGRTIATVDRPYFRANLCLVCVRVFHYCSQKKNLVAFLDSFRKCYRFGITFDAKISRECKKKHLPCILCKRNCLSNLIYYEDKDALIVEQTPSGACGRTDKPSFDCAHLCFQCCATLHISQACVFSSAQMAWTFRLCHMEPRLCLTKDAFNKHWAEMLWISQEFLSENRDNMYVDKPVESKKAEDQFAGSKILHRVSY